ICDECYVAFFFFQAEDGIRDRNVTGVQTCALPISFIDRLEESLGFPKFCPHGGTIPQKGELLQEIHRQPLNHISELGTYRICRVHDEVHLLNYLHEHHLTINDVVELVKQDSYDKTHTLIHNSQTLIIPERVAEQIYLEKIESL